MYIFRCQDIKISHVFLQFECLISSRQKITHTFEIVNANVCAAFHRLSQFFLLNFFVTIVWGHV